MKKPMEARFWLFTIGRLSVSEFLDLRRSVWVDWGEYYFGDRYHHRVYNEDGWCVGVTSITFKALDSLFAEENKYAED